MVSPRVRGSTPVAAIDGDFSHGFPADAGIDPMPAPSTPAPKRFPCAHGDRPSEANALADVAEVSPCPRGSTLCHHPSNGQTSGFPVPAGIALPGLPYGRTPEWFPRARGDRPHHHDPRRRHDPAPPHLRGSTSRHVHPVRGSIGSPAGAGIDPGTHRGDPELGGFPRGCGDRPARVAMDERKIRFPPQPRGSPGRDWIQPPPRGHRSAPGREGFLKTSHARTKHRLKFLHPFLSPRQEFFGGIAINPTLAIDGNPAGATGRQGLPR